MKNYKSKKGTLNFLKRYINHTPALGKINEISVSCDRAIIVLNQIGNASHFKDKFRSEAYYIYFLGLLYRVGDLINFKIDAHHRKRLNNVKNLNNPFYFWSKEFDNFKHFDRKRKYNFRALKNWAQSKEGFSKLQVFFRNESNNFYENRIGWTSQREYINYSKKFLPFSVKRSKSKNGISFAIFKPNKDKIKKIVEFLNSFKIYCQLVGEDRTKFENFDKEIIETNNLYVFLIKNKKKIMNEYSKLIKSVMKNLVQHNK